MFEIEMRRWRVREGDYEETYDTYRETLPVKIIAMNRELYVSGSVGGSVSGSSHIDGSVCGAYGGHPGFGVMAGNTHGSGQMSGGLSGSQSTTYLYTATLRDENSGRCYDMFISTDDYHNFKVGDTVYVECAYREFIEKYSEEKIERLRTQHDTLIKELEMQMRREKAAKQEAIERAAKKAEAKEKHDSMIYGIVGVLSAFGLITTITGIALISVIGGYATIIILAGLLVTVLALIHVPSKDTGK